MPLTSSIETLTASGAEFGEYAGARTPASFTSPGAELETLRSAAAVYDLSWRGKLVVTGEDRIRWMNGMVTSNVRDLPAQHGNFAFILNAQGRIQADVMIFNRGEFLLVTTEISQIARVKEYFDRYIIMDDVEVTEITEKLASIGVAGKTAADVMTRAGLLPRAVEAGEVLDSTFNGVGYSIARSPIEFLQAYELWFAPENYDKIWTAIRDAGARPVGSKALEDFRIINGLPRMGQDIGERELPQETGQAYALHYAKGCYIGQEIVERIHSRGNVNRVFSGLKVEGTVAPDRGAKVSTAEKEVGEVTSSTTVEIAGTAQTVALAYLRREASAPGTQVKIGDASAQVVVLPFVL